ncbi:MAG: Fe(3+) ABC transporter substrate-binding protein [Cyanobacteria bacterium SID2]|nr:Fe(3+) ABC transporter substrate-binding protein [Cyanobacteria bacterium SID2]
MRRQKYWWTGIVTALVAIVVGCTTQPNPSGTPTSPATDNGEQVVNLYSSRHYDTDRSLYDNFTEQTGITVNLVEAKGDELIERIKSEGANSPADVYITVDAGMLWRAQEAEVLQPIASEVLDDKVPEYLRDPEGHWFGLSKRARVIVYNTETVSPDELSTYEDLADPKWQGRLIVRSSNNIYNQSLVGSILAANGEEATEEWVKGIVENFARPPEGNDTAQIRAVADGVADVALANSYYMARLANSSDPEERSIAEKVDMFFPNQDDRGTHVNISGIGVAANAPHRENAIQFIEYLVSPEAQVIFAKGNNEFPVVDGVDLDNPYLEKYAAFKEDTLNAAVFGKNNAEALKIMDRAGWK